MDHSIAEKLLDETLALAHSAVAKGNHPFGALLATENGEVVFRQENEVISRKCATAHAELLLIQNYQKTNPKIPIKELILFTSTEPCAMCAGATFWSKVSTIYYGASAEALGKHATGSFVVPCEKLYEFGTRDIKVIQAKNPKPFENIHQEFWTKTSSSDVAVSASS